ncbi:plasma membrane proteolipid 3 [Rhizophagus clarus]|uniref:Plasma membrane proteolipid 3 n=1 Tax=Rhizophagus clarus TaxID=94130 RepID=A0A8H3M326_9GLOM|nr:plasma membrane proteolipid 3 [Rhizophagus clarus]
MAEYTGWEICALIFAFLFPPLGVFMKRGCSVDLCISILFTILGWLPGIIHAFYVIYKHRKFEERVLEVYEEIP